jgi:hypothetical protein
MKPEAEDGRPRNRGLKFGLGLSFVSIVLCAIGFYRSVGYSPPYDLNPKFEQVKDKTFINTEVVIDGKDFVGCTFIHVTFVFNGRATAHMSYCTIEMPCGVRAGNIVVEETTRLYKALNLIRPDVPFLSDEGKEIDMCPGCVYRNDPMQPSPAPNTGASPH